MQKQQPHWPAIKRFAFSAGLSAYEAEAANTDDSETLTAMAGLSVCRTDSSHSIAYELLIFCVYHLIGISYRFLLFRTTSREPSQEPMEQDESK